MKISLSPARARGELRAYRLAFLDACAETPHGDGTLLDAVDATLAAMPAAERRRIDAVTIFERTRPEAQRLLQGPEIALSDEEADAVFVRAMQIESK